MENIVRLTPDVVITLMERLSHADLHGKSVRICTGSDVNPRNGQVDTWVKWDIGNTGWTPPLYGE